MRSPIAADRTIDFLSESFLQRCIDTDSTNSIEVIMNTVCRNCHPLKLN
jgi:ribosomal protein L31